MQNLSVNESGSVHGGPAPVGIPGNGIPALVEKNKVSRDGVDLSIGSLGHWVIGPTKKQATKNKPKRHQKASILTELLMDGAASEVFISGPNGFLYHRRPDGTITKREGIKR